MLIYVFFYDCVAFLAKIIIFKTKLKKKNTLNSKKHLPSLPLFHFAFIFQLMKNKNKHENKLKQLPYVYANDYLKENLEKYLKLHSKII